MLEQARRQAEAARATAAEATWSFEKICLDKVRARFPEPAPGWDGDSFEEWRGSGHQCFTEVLRAGAGPYFDWLSPFLDVDTISRSGASWLRFWLYDVDRNMVPRCWLRWAFERLQSLRKVTDGTPCDAQLGTYLVSCDHFVSADRTLLAIVDKLRDVSPVSLGATWSVPGRATSEALWQVFGGLRSKS